MPGFDRLIPTRKVVDEIIGTGATQPTGVTGWTAKGYGGARYNSWATPRAPSSSAFVMSAQVASSSAATTITTFSSSAGSAGLNSPDYPRAVKICPSTSQLATGNVVVNGTNQFGATVADTIALGGTGAPVDGAVAFKTITSVVLPAASSVTGAGAFVQARVGLSNIFGLDRSISTVCAIIRGAVNGTAETTAPIAGAANETASFSTAATSSAGALVEVLYLPEDTTHI